MTLQTLNDKTVIIVGGSSGMGWATAKMAHEQGARVTIASRSTSKLTAVQTAFPDIKTAVCDITRPNDITHLFNRFDHVDHVFVTAGASITGKLVESELVALRTILDQRLWALALIVKNAAPIMRDGSFIFTSGQWASRPPTDGAFMSAALAAVEALARGLALELAPIRVNVISPGLIDTPILGNGRTQVEQWAKTSLPLKRMGHADEIATAAIMLMTNTFITGEVLHIDGGGRLI